MALPLAYQKNIFLRYYYMPTKLSRYIKLHQSSDDKDSLLFFSTKNAAAGLIPSSLISDIEKDKLTKKDKETLLNLGFLVHSLAEEQQEILSFFHDVNNVDQSFKYVVVLNLDCNLGCKYCFEGKRKGKFHLSKETADQFVNFAIKRSDLLNKDQIKFVFYGGEPLLSLETIIYISKKMRVYAERKAVKYNFTLVTNGTLLTSEIVKKLTPLGLQGAKVTLDGPKYIHDRYRPFKSGSGSFDVIVNNIKKTSTMTRVQIGGNYTQDHYREFPLLLDFLSENGLTPDRIPIVKFDPVISESSEFAPPDFHDGCESPNEPWIAEATLFLREEILRRGYRTQKIMPIPCMVELINSFVVNYDGTLYKCPGMIGRKNCCIGNVTDGLIDYNKSHGIDAW
ncbi:MAG TPA: geopeptide radical SAM maturase, partial [Nitrospirota bacterium]|nr:geopeptide radical SAM maturase [Nitrospirota bacterium]